MADFASACLAAVLWTASPQIPRAIEVRGDTACPRPVEVQAALDGMIRAGGASVPPDVVELVRHGDSVEVRLLNAAGARLAERRLPGGRSCVERARAAAVIVAAWEVRLGAGQPLAMPSIPEASSRRAPPVATGIMPPAMVQPSTSPSIPPSAPAPDAPATPPQVAAGPPGLAADGVGRAAVSSPAAVVTEAAPPPAPLVSPIVVTASPPAGLFVATEPLAAPAAKQGADVVTARSQGGPARPPLQVEMAAGALASVVAKEWAAGASLEARLSRGESDFAIGVGGFAIDTHTVAINPGQGRWRRFGGVVDLRSVARWRVIRTELRAGLAAGALVVTGQAFPVNAGGTLLDVGGVVGLRSLFHLGRLSPWIDAGAAVWPSTRALYVTGTDRSADIPTFELFLGVGVALTAANR